MNKVVLRNLHNSELWELIDKNASHILIHKFNPYPSDEWWKTSIKINGKIELKDVSVRHLSFDLSTNLEGLKQILELNTLYLFIYQFSKPIPGSLQISGLPEMAKDKILKQNGLACIISNTLENTIIESYNESFIDGIRKNPLVKDKIVI